MSGALAGEFYSMSRREREREKNLSARVVRFLHFWIMHVTIYVCAGCDGRLLIEREREKGSVRKSERDV